jgi:bifunctional UDP-N-acetylglucosamine pyrophosphorylase/glucosamine-1-phosphate N-acetyltransferase
MKAVILAAGRGERLQPLTENKPKAMLPVCNKPLIDYQIETLRRNGIEEIAMVVGYKEEVIREHLSGFKMYRDKIKGTARAAYSARDFIDEDFLLIYGDIYFDCSIEEVIKEKNSMAVYEVRDVSRYGEVIFEGRKLMDIREKSGYGSGFVNAGIYHLEPEILDFVENTGKSERGEYELTTSILALSKEKEVKVVPLKGYWNDIGYPWDYIDVNMRVLKRMGFSVGENTEVWESAIIRKPVVIGKECEIKNCVLKSSVIGDECTVGEFSVVKRSVVMERSNVPHLNYVADSAIGEGCNLGAGTKIANLRFDDGNVKMKIKGEDVDTGRRKLGAIIGDGVKAGINVSIYPGVKIGSGAWIDAETLVRRDI